MLTRYFPQAKTHGFVLIVDDTVGSFANVDVIMHSDMLLTSLTKSFSGKSNVMGGSIVLNPLSSHYKELSERFKKSFPNELFTEDAQTLLSNSQDYFERTRILNSNAKAIAEFLHKSIGPNSPVKRVQYPSLLPTKPNFDAFKKPGTPELPETGYGCLLTVEFRDEVTAAAFYDRIGDGFYPSPHLGGHVTIVLPYNMFQFGKEKSEEAKWKANDILRESLRISAGLEKEEDLIDTLQDALDAVSGTEKTSE